MSSNSSDCPRKRSRSAPLKRRRGGIGASAASASVSVMSCHSNSASPLHVLRSCISAPEPMVTSGAAAEEKASEAHTAAGTPDPTLTVDWGLDGGFRVASELLAPTPSPPVAVRSASVGTPDATGLAVAGCGADLGSAGLLRQSAGIQQPHILQSAK